MKYDRAGDGSDDDDDDDDVGDSVSCVWARVPVAIANAPSRGGRREPWKEAAARRGPHARKDDPGFPVKLLWIPLPLRSLYDSTREEDGRQAGSRIPSFPR